MAEQDIKENEMTSVSSVDYVRGLKGKDSVLIKPRRPSSSEHGQWIYEKQLYLMGSGIESPEV